jgi:putative spermidine/putrescine transport system permease protein
LAFDLPLAVTMVWSVSDPDTGAPTIGNYVAFLSAANYLTVVWRSVAISVAVALATALIGYPLSYWMTRLSSAARGCALAAVVTTFWVPILVRTYAWVVVFGNGGLVNRLVRATGLTTQPIPFLYNEIGVAAGMINVLLPYMVLPLYAAMRRIDGRLLMAAATLGAGQGAVFRKVFLPLSLPALAASTVLVLILSLGFYVTPAILGGGRVPMIANMMDMLVNRFARWEMASVAALLLLCGTLLLYGLYQFLRERQ